MFESLRDPFSKDKSLICIFQGLRSIKSDPFETLSYLMFLTGIRLERHFHILTDKFYLKR